MTTETLDLMPMQKSYTAYSETLDDYVTELHVPVTVLFDLAPTSRAKAWLLHLHRLTNEISHSWSYVGWTGAMCWGDGFESEVVADFSNGRLI